MRLRDIKMGQKVVFFDRIGVWLKTGMDKAKCIYGPDNDKEFDIPPSAFVYAIWDNIRFRPQPQSPIPEAKPEDIQTKASLCANPDDSTKAEAPQKVSDPVGESIKAEIYNHVPTYPDTQAMGTGITIVLIDEDNDKKIMEIPNGDCFLLAAFAEGIIIGNMKYQMRETVLDYGKKILYVSVDAGSKLDLH